MPAYPWCQGSGNDTGTQARKDPFIFISTLRTTVPSWQPQKGAVGQGLIWGCRMGFLTFRVAKRWQRSNLHPWRPRSKPNVGHACGWTRGSRGPIQPMPLWDEDGVVGKGRGGTHFQPQRATVPSPSPTRDGSGRRRVGQVDGQSHPSPVRRHLPRAASTQP